MIERRYQTVEEVEQLEQWLAVPPSQRGMLPPEPLQDKWERLKLGHRWLHSTGGSRSKTIGMLCAHFEALGKPYSESTARRDVDDAQRIFPTLTPAMGRWQTGMMLDRLMERFDSCVRAHKDKEAAGYSREIDRWIERAEKYLLEDQEKLKDPVPVLAMYAPEEAGLTPDPNIREKIAAFKKRRESASQRPIQDVDFTELHSEPSPDAPAT